MKDTVKKFVRFTYYDYTGIEEKLNNYAQKGLFLEGITSQRWVFRKGEPKELKYLVTYFNDASIFDSQKSVNLETYIDYATEYGYTFVTQIGKMQIFSTDIDNPIPLETDPREKFENIKSCTSKGFMFNIYLMLALFSFNIILQLFNILGNPANFFSSNISQFALVMQLHVIFFYLNIIFSYKIWCRKCKNSLNTSGELAIYNPKFSKNVDKILMFTFGVIFIGYLFILLTEFNSVMLYIAFIPTVLLVIIFSFLLARLKKGKLTRNQNFTIYILVAIICTVIFNFVMFYVAINFTIDKDVNNGTVVTVNHPDGKQREIEIYSHDIPLTCEDLYEDAESVYYSYEADYSNTLFMKTSEYLQFAYWKPSIFYSIYEPKFNFVYNIMHDYLIDSSDSEFGRSYTTIDNSLFDTNEAYIRTYDGRTTGFYILFYDNMIITLDVEDELAEEQSQIVIDKLID